MGSRSRLLGVLVPGLLAISSIGLAACGGSSNSSTSASSSGGGSSSSSAPSASNVGAELAKFPAVVTAPAAAKKGGTLTAIANGDVDYIDPGAAYYQPTYMIDLAVDSPLMGWPPNDTAAPVPLLGLGGRRRSPTAARRSRSTSSRTSTTARRWAEAPAGASRSSRRT